MYVIFVVFNQVTDGMYIDCQLSKLKINYLNRGEI